MQRSRHLIMGILNVTPDSFSDGGRYLDTDTAISHGLAMAAQGADVVDVGGESTRPGAEPVSIDEELARVIPVIERLGPTIPVSIDTRHEPVARAAVAAGARYVNDISASLHQVAADSGVAWIAMHMSGNPRTMQQNPSYGDVAVEVSDFLTEAATVAKAAGVQEIWVDPGIGFGKTTEHNLTLLKNIERLTTLGYPVVVGASRKRFLGAITANADPDDRLEASLATAAWCWGHGVTMLRVHDVLATARVRATLEAIESASG